MFMVNPEVHYRSNQVQRIVDGNPIFSQLASAISLIKPLLPFDSMIAITDSDKFLYCFQGQKVNSQTFRGEPLLPQSALVQCQIRGEKTIITYPKEIYGVPVKTSAMPIRDLEQSGIIIGAIGVGILGYIFEGDTIIAESETMRKVLRMACRVASVDSSIMIQGESGSGKEVVAKYIHTHSKRAKGPFVAINCAAFPEHLIESEMFGYRKGAFTGANIEGKIGLFETANNGTLFLDEIAELPLTMQSKMLRVLETGEIRRLGDTVDRRTNFRLIVATHRDLTKMVAEGMFRQDLYYRLNVVPISIPPLRERPEDIVMLARKFQEDFCRKYELNYELDLQVLNSFLRYSWPGNIRELRNEVERRVIVGTKEINDDIVDTPPPQYDLLKILGFSGKLKEVTPKFEEQYINSVIECCDGRIGKAAEKLGISRMALYKRLKRKKEK